MRWGAGRGGGGEGGVWTGARVSGNTSAIPGVLSSPLISAIPNQVKAAHAAEREEIPAKMVTYLFRSHALHSSG